MPETVEVGAHLCYRDIAETRFVEPKDAEILTRFANLVAEQTQRPLAWLHLPVPIERDDAAFFAPLEQWSINASTEAYLGLVRRQDWRVALSGSGSPRIGKCDSGDREARRTTFVVDSLMDRAAALAINMSYEGVARVEHRLPKNHEPVTGAT